MGTVFSFFHPYTDYFKPLDTLIKHRQQNADANNSAASQFLGPEFVVMQHATAKVMPPP